MPRPLRGHGSANSLDHFDVVVVGAGISGISNAWHLRHMCPSKSFVILESRQTLGGTWDLFRYPGARSDSDMYTLGFKFKPWTDAKSIAEAPLVLNYLNETVNDNGFNQHISFGHTVTAANWSTDKAQ